jgi:hypothetical protein
MVVTLFYDLSRVGAVPSGSGSAGAVGAAEPAAHERLDLIELVEALLNRGAVAETADRLGGLVVEQKVRHASFARAGERILEFPLGCR